VNPRQIETDIQIRHRVPVRVPNRDQLELGLQFDTCRLVEATANIGTSWINEIPTTSKDANATRLAPAHDPGGGQVAASPVDFSEQAPQYQWCPSLSDESATLQSPSCQSGLRASGVVLDGVDRLPGQLRVSGDLRDTHRLLPQHFIGSLVSPSNVKSLTMVRITTPRRMNSRITSHTSS
jgi:hypothetical protein